MIKGFFVDAINKEITEVEIPISRKGSSYKYLKTHAATFSGLVCVGKIFIKDDMENTLYCDDEGLLHAKDINPGFSFTDMPSMIIGNAVIEGLDDYGYPYNTNLTLDEVKSAILFKDFTKEEVAKQLENSFKFIPLR